MSCFVKSVGSLEFASQGNNESTKVHNPRRNQSTGITRIRYTVRYIRGSGLAMRARYLPRIGTVRYRYIPVLGMRIIYRATAALQGKQSAAIMSIHDGKHKYHSPK